MKCWWHRDVNWSTTELLLNLKDARWVAQTKSAKWARDYDGLWETHTRCRRGRQGQGPGWRGSDFKQWRWDNIISTRYETILCDVVLSRSKTIFAAFTLISFWYLRLNAWWYWCIKDYKALMFSKEIYWTSFHLGEESLPRSRCNGQRPTWSVLMMLAMEASKPTW